MKGQLDDTAKIRIISNFSSIIRVPTGQSTPPHLPTVSVKDRLQPVTNRSFTSGQKTRTETDCISELPKPATEVRLQPNLVRSGPGLLPVAQPDFRTLDYEWLICVSYYHISLEATSTIVAICDMDDGSLFLHQSTQDQM